MNLMHCTNCGKQQLNYSYCSCGNNQWRGVFNVNVPYQPHIGTPPGFGVPLYEVPGFGFKHPLTVEALVESLKKKDGVQEFEDYGSGWNAALDKFLFEYLKTKNVTQQVKLTTQKPDEQRSS